MKNKVFFVSLGCDKNLVDSEMMLGLLDSHGYEITDDETQAEVIVINTCCFIGDAKEESIRQILDMAQYKEEGMCRALIVTGCLSQRYQQEIFQELPEVDAVLGTMSYDRIVWAIDNALQGNRVSCFEPISRTLPANGRRLLSTGGHYAYLKIAEGCSKHCTYCVIPSVRGEYRSFPMEELLEMAQHLVNDGVKELILVAQETTLYGTDLYGKKSLGELLRRLCKIEGLRWIRILYCYPEEIDDDLIEVMAEEEKVCHYLDLPIQHANDEILHRMGRKTSKEQLMEIIARLRERIPDIFLRTTLITGFPGESEEAHQELMDFIDEMAFDRLGVFPYSPEENTPAFAMPNQIPEDVKERRRDELMQLQQEISYDLALSRVGEEMVVMVEGKVTDPSETEFEDLPEGDVYVCRTFGDAPGVDGYLFLLTDETLMSGDFARVRVTGANAYDLMGELVK